MRKEFKVLYQIELRQLWFVFDAQHEKDVQVYNAIKRLPTRFFKVDIGIFLYNYEMNVVSEKWFR